MECNFRRANTVSDEKMHVLKLFANQGNPAHCLHVDLIKNSMETLWCMSLIFVGLVIFVVLQKNRLGAYVLIIEL